MRKNKRELRIMLKTMIEKRRKTHTHRPTLAAKGALKVTKNENGKVFRDIFSVVRSLSLAPKVASTNH